MQRASRATTVPTSPMSPETTAKPGVTVQEQERQSHHHQGRNQLQQYVYILCMLHKFQLQLTGEGDFRPSILVLL